MKNNLNENMHRAYFIICLAIIIFLSCSSALKEQDDKISAIKNFYKAALALQNDGIPEKTDIEKLSPFISKPFKNLLLEARKAEDKYFQKTKGEVPPLIEGSLFFSLFEGADKVISITAETKTDKISYLIEFEYRDRYGKKEKIRWRDRVILVMENNKGVVNDLELLGKWPFGAKGKLSDILKNVIKVGNDL
jgi:hypothetical protein